MSISSFRGGVHLPSRRELTKDSPFLNIAVPYFCRFPMSQHMGKPAIPCVSIGDHVEEGQIIGTADGEDSAHIHTSIPGRVTDISEQMTIWGEPSRTITVEAQGAFPFFRGASAADWSALSHQQIHSIIKDAGIVRMEESAVPEHLKISADNDPRADTLIINTLENEPYLSTGNMLIHAHTEALIEGARILLKLTGAKKCIFAVDRKAHAQGELLKKTERGFSGIISVVKVTQVYPSASERMLVRHVCGITIPPDKQLKDYGIVIETAATLFAIYEAVTGKKPLYERYITISGKGIRKPGNYKIRTGTLLSHIIDECGGFSDDTKIILAGGPMKGIQIDNFDLPVDKRVSALLFLTQNEISPRREYPCITCGKCIDACPVRLDPRALALSSSQDGCAKSCISCSACSYV
ncbi:MAG: RnfABCDGE type electron transport complex subunit C, partial [Spirochaetota bacterium]